MTNKMNMSVETEKFINSFVKDVFVLPPTQDVAEDKHLIELSSMEQSTWSLLHILYNERLTNRYSRSSTSDEDGMDDVLICPNLSERSSEKDVSSLLFQHNTQLRQAQLILDWLEEKSRNIMKNDHNILEFSSDNMNAWENTLHTLKQQKSSYIPTKNIVTQLDPDSTSRQKKKLLELDDEDEKKLFKYIFSCIKSGMLDEACRMCHKVGHSWRSVTLQGWKLYHDDNISHLAPGGRISQVEGNLYRSLWRKTCQKMLQDVFVDEAVDRNIKYYKENKMIMTSMLGGESDADKLLTLEHIFSNIESCDNDIIKRQSQFRYHIIQKFIILGRVDVLIEYMSSWCLDKTSQAHPQLLKFMTHLTLFFRSYHARYRAEHETTIIKSYVEYLIGDNQSELIAKYTSYLPRDLQNVLYAKFLEGVIEVDKRQHSLQLASEFGLDLKSIIILVVNNICRREPFLEPLINTGFGGPGQLMETVTQADMKKIDCIGWLLFDEDWRLEAIKHSNFLFRVFICSRKIEACDILMKKLPIDSIQVIVNAFESPDVDKLPAHVDNAIREHICIKIYLEAQERFCEWFQWLHGKPSKPKGPGHMGSTLSEKMLHESNMKMYEEDLERWNKTLSSFAQKAVEKIKDVLTFVDGGWMVDQRQDDETVDEMRVQQIILLRQLCLPALFVLLQKIYHTMNMYKESMQLIDLLMSQQHQLYKVFSRGELEKYAYETLESS
ncbi:hypothetical protein HELRODRAFT_189911, partial [Helobdella robusta]|uniref:Nuclear pore complex protein n=1 Tax=Helobdella robusta TaxID=6412 RepID=T1FRH2_HELRO